jgi:hypothetical protein
MLCHLPFTIDEKDEQTYYKMKGAPQGTVIRITGAGNQIISVKLITDIAAVRHAGERNFLQLQQ